MYKAFLSHLLSFEESLTMLQDNGLIEYEGGQSKHTRTAEKGMRLLHIYNKMYELVPPLQQRTLT